MQEAVGTPPGHEDVAAQAQHTEAVTVLVNSNDKCQGTIVFCSDTGPTHNAENAAFPCVQSHAPVLLPEPRSQNRIVVVKVMFGQSSC